MTLDPEPLIPKTRKPETLHFRILILVWVWFNGGFGTGPPELTSFHRGFSGLGIKVLGFMSLGVRFGVQL